MFYVGGSGFQPRIAQPDGISPDGKIVGIELLDASKKISIDSFLTYEIEAESMGEFSEASNRNAPTNQLRS